MSLTQNQKGMWKNVGMLRRSLGIQEQTLRRNITRHSSMVCSVFFFFFLIDFLAITQVKRLLHKTKNLDVPREILCPKDTRFTISIHFEIVSFLVLCFGL